MFMFSGDDSNTFDAFLFASADVVAYSLSAAFVLIRAGAEANLHLLVHSSAISEVLSGVR